MTSNVAVASGSPILFGVVFGVAVLMVAVGLGRRHPWHNVLIFFTLAVGCSWAGEALLGVASWPVGRWPVFPGPRLPGGVPVLNVLFWVSAVGSARAVGRFCLWSWRGWHAFGYGLLAVSVLAATLLGVEAAPAGGWRVALFAAVLLLCVTPTLIVKSGSPPLPESLGGLAWLWLLACLALTTR
jgi:hypothetical protein